MNKEKKYLTLEEAEKIVDDMYQKRWEECGVEVENTIYMGNLDKLEYTELEKASLLLLRTELRLKRENKQLKEQLEGIESILGSMQKRNLINKFNKEYDEEDKKKNPNRSHAEIIPDAEEVYRRYYAMKTQQKEFIEYISSYIELLNDKPDLVELSQKDVLEEILSKYKEIIGEEKCEK